MSSNELKIVVDATKTPPSQPTKHSSVKKVQKFLDDRSVNLFGKGTKVLRIFNNSSNSKNTVPSDFAHGVVGTCFRAYNEHYKLVLSPDDLWISICVAFAGHVERNAEELRNQFVNHDGKKELVAYDFGTIWSVDFQPLVAQITNQLDKEVKGNVAAWMQCDFSTTTDVSKFVSRMVLMGAMKKYFDFKFVLRCGLPEIVLRGTQDDWKKLQAKSRKLAQYGLQEWSEVLEFVLQHFVDAYTSNPPPSDFWNRVAHQVGGGSGPRYLSGWITAFAPFNEQGKYMLNDLETIRGTNCYAKINTNDVAPGYVCVPVTIDDNGRIYKTQFLAGSILSSMSRGDTLEPSLDVVLVDVTEATGPEMSDF
jgi:hypothetical protein